MLAFEKTDEPAIVFKHNSQTDLQALNASRKFIMQESESHFNKIDATYRDFRVVKLVPIPEINCILRILEHGPSGAQVMHIENDDPENLFCLSFQTLPESSNGVAHILEHTVLCGSKKFPIKDPFFAMTRRSLNTFMNALTGSDFTCYPAASQIPQDFYNLLEVYIDAVFHPKLSELSFRQEGHRLEFEDTDNPESALVHRGIVFNEMKGVMNSASSRLHEVMYAALFPNLTYGYNSGGDPKDIPHLSYEELIAFHTKFYHPTHCLFFFCGDMPLKNHLDFILEHALKGVQKAEPLAKIPLQERFRKPLSLTASYPLAPHEDPKDKTMIAFGCLTCHVLEQEACLALSILEIILLETDASPLKHALLHSGLCKQVSSYIDTEISEVPFLIQMKGCQSEDADKLEQLLRSTLEQIIKEGISKTAVENAIHQLEFHRSEITGDYAPFGLSLFMRSALLKQHGGLPESGLMIHSLFDDLRKKDSSYYTNLIKQYLLDNPHFVRVVLVPDKELENRELNEERKVLKEMQERLSAEEKIQLVEKANRLKAYQKALEEEDEDVLPKISLTDVPKDARKFSLSTSQAGNLEVLHHRCFTNEIVYADLVFDLPSISLEDLPFVRLITVLLPQLGAGRRNYQENLEYLQANTGGLSTYISLNLQAQNHNEFHPTFHIRGKALHRKAEYLFPLLHETAQSPDFQDIDRIKTIIMKHYTNIESSLNSGALKYAINLSGSNLNLPSKIAEAWYGLSYYWFLRELTTDFDKNKESIADNLRRIKDLILCVGQPHLVLSCDEHISELLKKQRYYGLEEIKAKPSSAWDFNYPLFHMNSEGRLISSPVAFIGKVFETVSYIHEDAAALNIAACLFDNLILHPKIREQGGAYGGGATSNTLSGNFYFYSYRDPNIFSSLEAFKESVEAIAQGKFEDSDLEEAKLEIIQGLDSPISPGSRADVAFSWLNEGKTDAIRQNFRNKILALTRGDVIQSIERQIIPNFPKGADIVFAGRDLLEKENKLLESKGLKPLKLLTLEDRSR